MFASSRRTALFASLVVVASFVYTAPAGAMGRAGTPSIRPSIPQAVDRLGRIEADQKNVTATLQAQVATLRQEVADLKARVERQDVAVAE